MTRRHFTAVVTLAAPAKTELHTLHHLLRRAGARAFYRDAGGGQVKS